MRVSDEILKEAIHKAAKGDENASKIIYENFAMYVLTICRRYGIQSDLLKDYLQDIFSECFQSIHRFDSEKGEFKYWLRKITVNLILKKKRKENILDHALEINDFQHDFMTAETNEFEMQEILKALSKMPKQFSVIFNLFVIDGYSAKEISQMLDINEGTIRSYVTRGREWARQNLKHLHPEKN